MSAAYRSLAPLSALGLLCCLLGTGYLRWNAWAVGEAVAGRGKPPFNWRALLSFGVYEWWLDDHLDRWEPGP